MEGNEKLKNEIDTYIEQFTEEIQERLIAMRQIINETVPEAKEKISYQMPTFWWKENLVHFAAFQKHIGFYPGPSGVVAFEEELTPYKHAKGSIQFPLDKPIPYDLVRRITAFRLQEVKGNPIDIK